MGTIERREAGPVQSTHGVSNQRYDGCVAVAPAKPSKLLRLPVVEERTGLKKTTIYSGMAAKTFPAPVRLSSRAVAWREDEIDGWIAERVKKGEAA